jgi:hypothetical protein
MPEAAFCRSFDRLIGVSEAGMHHSPDELDRLAKTLSPLLAS